MGAVAFLVTRTKLPAWLIEIAMAGLLVLGIWFSGVFHEKARIETRIVKQQVKVEKRVVETDHTHDQELFELRTYRDTHPVQPVRLCKSASMPPSPSRQPGPAAADVQPLPRPDPSVRPAAGPDISELLGLLAQRGDEVSAGLRRRQSLEP